MIVAGMSNCRDKLFQTSRIKLEASVSQIFFRVLKYSLRTVLPFRFGTLQSMPST